MKPQQIALSFSDSFVATIEGLPGDEPLVWSIDEKSVFLRRPCGTWSFPKNGLPYVFFVYEKNDMFEDGVRGPAKISLSVKHGQWFYSPENPLPGIIPDPNGIAGVATWEWRDGSPVFAIPVPYAETGVPCAVASETERQFVVTWPSGRTMTCKTAKESPDIASLVADGRSFARSGSPWLSWEVPILPSTWKNLKS